MRPTKSCAEVFAERRREITVEWRDGDIREARESLTEGLSARWKGASGQRQPGHYPVDGAPVGLWEGV